MAEESRVAAFLEAEVPDWGDEIISRARYKAFTGQRADYEARLQFWKTLVVKCARHLNLVVIDANMVRVRFFVSKSSVREGKKTRDNNFHLLILI
jgi:charged multivesicular body protein 7